MAFIDTSSSQLDSCGDSYNLGENFEAFLAINPTMGALHVGRMSSAFSLCQIIQQRQPLR